MINKDTSPTIEQSLKMIEEKLKTQKKNIKVNKNIIKNTNKDSSLINLFENKEENKKIEKIEKKDNVLLLTRKVDEKGKIIDTKKKPKEKIDLNIKDHINLIKITDLAVIIKKLKNIRDRKINNDKGKISNKISGEIKKLNETINLAEELFKKELLDL